MDPGFGRAANSAAMFLPARTLPVEMKVVAIGSALSTSSAPFFSLRLGPLKSQPSDHLVPVATRRTGQETTALRDYVLRGSTRQAALLHTQIQNQ